LAQASPAGHPPFPPLSLSPADRPGPPVSFIPSNRPLPLSFLWMETGAAPAPRCHFPTFSSRSASFDEHPRPSQFPRSQSTPFSPLSFPREQWTTARASPRFTERQWAKPSLLRPRSSRWWAPPLPRALPDQILRVLVLSTVLAACSGELRGRRPWSVPLGSLPGRAEGMVGFASSFSLSRCFRSWKPRSVEPYRVSPESFSPSAMVAAVSPPPSGRQRRPSLPFPLLIRWILIQRP
jgi:hypothetical protein